MAVLIDVLTGIGGGMARDVLVSEVPVVFTVELYAAAAFAVRPWLSEGTSSFPLRADSGYRRGCLCCAAPLGHSEPLDNTGGSAAGLIISSLQKQQPARLGAAGAECS